MLLFVAMASGVNIPYVDILVRNAPFPLLYIQILLATALAFSFLFLVFTDPGDGSVRIAGSEVLNYHPRLRAVLISALMMSISFIVAYTRDELQQTPQAMIMVSVLFMLHYNAMTTLYYLFFQNSGNLLLEAKSKNSNFFWAHRDRKEKTENFNKA